MGRLHPVKSFDILIKAFYIYIKKNKNAILLIAGGDDGHELKSLVIKLNLENSVFDWTVNFDDKKIY